MSPTPTLRGRLGQLLRRGPELLLVAGLLLATVGVAVHLVQRLAGVAGTGAAWPEWSRLAFVWMVFVASVLAARQAAHVHTERYIDRLPRRLRQVCVALHECLVVACCAALFWGTWQQHRSGSALPLWLLAAGYVVTAGIAMMSLLHLRRLARTRLR